MSRARRGGPTTGSGPSRVTVRADRTGLPAVALVLAIVLAGCGTAVVGPSGGEGSPTRSVAPSGSAASADPSAEASDEPSAPTITPTGTAEPTSEPTASAGPPGYATECSGNSANRSFFADVAAVVAWDVYCGVVPDGWFVESGNYRLRDGGQLTIAYRGPDGSRLELREGAFCVDGSCAPSGQASGTGAFGDRTGSFVDLEGGGYAVVVDPGEAVTWLAVGANLDEATFRQLAGALQLVAR